MEKTKTTIWKCISYSIKSGDFSSSLSYNFQGKKTFFAKVRKNSMLLGSWWQPEIRETHQLSLIVENYHDFQGVLYYPNGGWPWNFWSINSFMDFLEFLMVKKSVFLNQANLFFWGMASNWPTKIIVFQKVPSWWLNQPIWKICSSNWVHLPQFSGWTSKNIWVTTT